MGFIKKTGVFLLLSLLVAFSSSAVETADIIVAKDGSGKFTTIQAAINSIAAGNSKNVTILIKNGTYEEHIGIDKSYISLIGEDRAKTIIRFSIEREAWASKNGSNVGCAVVNIGCTSGYKKSSTVTDVVIGNLTIENTYDSKTVKTMAVKDEGNSNRVYIVNCNIWSQGHDTISLWSSNDGMYYHSGCSFKGALDFVCPRGWCYIVNSEFLATASSAPLWHEARSTQKFTVRTSKFLPAQGNSSKFKLMNANNSSTVGTRFYVLDCTMSSSCNTIGTKTEAYFYNCHGESSDQAWYANNLTASAASSQSAVTPKWTFDNKWDPENAMPAVLTSASLPQPWSGAYDLPGTDIQLKWVKARNAEKYAVYFGSSNTPAFAAIQAENAYSPKGLAKGTYYWRVDAISGSDTVKGELWSFTVAQGVGVADIKSALINPSEFRIEQCAGGNIEFNWVSGRSCAASIKLMNLQGKEVASIPLEKNSAGVNNMRLDISRCNLSKGKYIAKLYTGETLKTAEFVLR